jgi:antitoxin (DNA-binding transcriptional repressor) of toxin-antitoxin stability system
MYTVTVEEVQEKLPEILEDVKRGVEVVIQQNNITVANIGPVSQTTDAPAEDEKPHRQFGSAKDRLIYMADDFDAPLEDFADYM